MHALSAYEEYEQMLRHEAAHNTQEAEYWAAEMRAMGEAESAHYERDDRLVRDSDIDEDR